MSARYEKYRDKAGEYRLRLKNPLGSIIAVAEGYSSASNRDTAIAFNRANCSTPYFDTAPLGFAKYEIFRGTDDRWYWRLRSSNGRVVIWGGQGFSNYQGAYTDVDQNRTFGKTQVEFELTAA